MSSIPLLLKINTNFKVNLNKNILEGKHTLRARLVQHIEKVGRISITEMLTHKLRNQK